MFTGFTPDKVCRANSLSRNHANLSPEIKKWVADVSAECSYFGKESYQARLQWSSNNLSTTTLQEEEIKHGEESAHLR